MSDTRVTPNSAGFVFAGTDEPFLTVARRAARSLRLVHPDAQIDLFTSAPIDDPVFDQVHTLTDTWFRPKINAMLQSRFKRTVYLDTDAVAVADLTPIFDVLETHDVAACHDRWLNSTKQDHDLTIPFAYPVVNSGVFGIRKSDRTQAFLTQWMQDMKQSDAAFDQPDLRRLLYHSDLRLCVLPPTFNFMTVHELDSWWGVYSAPRVLHIQNLHRRPLESHDPHTPITPQEAIGPVYAKALRQLIAMDRTLNPDAIVDDTLLFKPHASGLLQQGLRHALRPYYQQIRSMVSKVRPGK